MGADGRDFDVVLYGASGFVGKLTAAYLARADPSLRIALAGRSFERLRRVRDGLGVIARDWPLLIAELADDERLRDVAASARVVVSTVGPYSRYGLPLVAACAATGTDYTDLTGEIPFVRDSIDQHHESAIGSHARIVHSCGFDSVPSDLTVYALHRRALIDGAGDLGETTLVLHAYTGGYAGGSIATMLELMRLSSTDPRIRRMLDDPYSLSPHRGAEPDLGPQPDLPLRRGSDIAPRLHGLWLGGYLMAPYNTRCVRRSNALQDWAYGRRLRYSETISMGSTPAAPALALMFNAGISGASRLGGEFLRMLPREVVDGFAPKSGSGHDEGMRGRYVVETYATTTSGKRYVATMAQQGDPGYTATAAILGECTLGLLKNRGDLPQRFGVLTPATAMGDVLLARLPAAGVRLSVTAQGR
jgi:short subunit dehydrogenase-like uncharacterized protein